MATSITTRAGKGSALSWTEHDANITNLRDAIDANATAHGTAIAALQASQQAGTIGFTTKALMDADLDHPANTLAMVTNDATLTNNVTWIKLGASGAGSWQKSALNPFLPYYDSRNYSDLADWVTEIGSTEAVLEVTSTLTVAADLETPANAHIIADRPGRIIVADTKTLTVSGPFAAGYHTVFPGLGNVLFQFGTTASVPAAWLGDVGDNSTDCQTAINKAITAAQGHVPVDLLPGTHLCAGATGGGILANVTGTHLRGVTNGFVYGATSSRVAIKFTGGDIGITTFTDPDDPYNVAYMTIENLTVDANNVCEMAFSGGFFTNLINSTFINGTVAGAYFKFAQRSIIDNCGFHGNLDGLLVEGGGTIYSRNSAYRANTRHGINYTGTGGSSSFTDNIIESNGEAGVNLDGDLVNIKFSNNYYEANDSAAGENGRHIVVDISGAFKSKGIVFEGEYLSSTGSTKAAEVTAGKVIFRHSTLVGDTTKSPYILAEGAQVIIDNSFEDYLYPPGSVLTDSVRVDPNAVLCFPGNGGYVSIAGRSIAFGTGDFAVSMIHSPIISSQATRLLLSGGFCIYLLGTTAGITGVATGPAGSLHTTVTPVQNSIYSHLVYVRQSNVGYLYLNRVLVESFADANNYSTIESYVGGNGTTGAIANLAAFCTMDVAPSPTEIGTLLDNGGNPYSAGLSDYLTLNLNFACRAGTTVKETVSNTNLTLAGTAAWASKTA